MLYLIYFLKLHKQKTTFLLVCLKRLADAFFFIILCVLSTFLLISLLSVHLCLVTFFTGDTSANSNNFDLCFCPCFNVIRKMACFTSVSKTFFINKTKILSGCCMFSTFWTKLLTWSYLII